MEKVISINFQGRVIPIEETAYNNLKRYTDSLRTHFAKEESSDEIINDIENRIAELFDDRLKRGAPCINNMDVNVVIDSIGRLEDIEAAEAEEPHIAASENERQRQTYAAPQSRGRFYRNEDDKVIAGVCSGVAVRTGIDPIFIRILFVLLFGVMFWVYIFLWIIVPSQSIQTSVTRRLFRNPDDKRIAGVCGGLAAYFNTSNNVMRLIFLVPFIISIISGGVHAMWWNWHFGFGPRLIFGGLGSTMLLTYIILWIAVPYASSVSEKLEMKGEKVDLHSIKATSQAKASAPSPRRRSGFGHVIAVIFKAFFFLIAGSVALGMFGVLIALVFGGVAVMPYTDFFVQNNTINLMAWIGALLMLGIPLLSLITWGVGRMTGARRTGRNYIGYIFTVLWVAGLLCVINVVATMIREFSTRHRYEEAVAISQPGTNKLYVNVSSDALPSHAKWHIGWYQDDDDDDTNDDPFRIVNTSQLWVNSVKVKVAQSPDSLYHVYKVVSARGNTEMQAQERASHVKFPIAQHDSILTLPRGFTVSNKDKFRDQRVLVVVEVPVGKGIQIDNDIRRYEWYDVDVHNKHYRIYSHNRRHRHMRHRWHDKWNDKNYIMTHEGLKNTEDSVIEESSGWDDED